MFTLQCFRTMHALWLDHFNYLLKTPFTDTAEQLKYNKAKTTIYLSCVWASIGCDARLSRSFSPGFNKHSLTSTFQRKKTFFHITKKQQQSNANRMQEYNRSDFRIFVSEIFYISQVSL